MALSHASITPGESVHAARPEGHSVKRSYVPIKPAFRPLLPKPIARDSSPSHGIHIHTRATLNAGRKRLVTPKSLDLHKRRRPASQPVSQSSSHTVSSLNSPESVKSESPLSATAAKPVPMPVSQDAVAMAAPTDFQLNIGHTQSAASSTGFDDMFSTPATPSSSMSESPQSVNMASLVDAVADSPATIDPVYMVMEEKQPNTLNNTLDSTLLESGVLDSSGLEGLGLDQSSPELSNPFTDSLNAGFAGSFDDLSDFYFRDTSSTRTSTEDVVSNFVEMEPQAEEEPEESTEFSVMDYFAPATDMF